MSRSKRSNSKKTRLNIETLEHRHVLAASAIINEIHYNPGPDLVVDPDAEFIELYNPGDEDFDLSGMSFVGFDLTFAEGTTLAAGQYAIVAPSIAIAESTWGVTPIQEFALGGISGGGELIQLIGADGTTVVDEVLYDDVAPWPGAPDGNGPSLELADPTSDNSLVASWGASEGDPTPAAQNSIFGQDPAPAITNITITPAVVLPSQAFTIAADIDGATTATLVYKVGFDGVDQSVVMTNTGGDNWSASVPGAAAGELIRYQIQSDVESAPAATDTVNYLGLVVSPTDVVGNTLPLFQFFVNEAEFAELTQLPKSLTNDKIPAVVAFGGEVYDNATVRVRGGDFSREFFPKKSLKFELPSGYGLDIGEEGSYPIDEWGIQADFGDWGVASPDISWDVFNAETDSFTSSFFVRAEINSDYHGYFRFQELYDGAWRNANGYGDDELYKAEPNAFGAIPDFDKKNPDDGDSTSLLELNDIVLTESSPAKTSWLYENVDIANVVNHMAISVLMRHDDQEVQNFYVARDAETGLWSMVEWDLDRTWTDDEAGDFTTPEPIFQELLNSVWAVPEFQDMYWRRIQTLVDTYLADDSLVDRYNELIAEIGETNSALDFARWGRNDVFSNPYWADEFQVAIDTRQAIFAAEPRMPGSASGNYDVVINELHYNPLDGDAEFLELYNNSTESVDMSNWTIGGVGLTIPFGTVALPGEYVVFTDNYNVFRDQYPGDIFAAAQYPGGQSGGGELITLSDADGNVVDSVSYDDVAPWPTEPDGDGFTLALLDPNSDNSLPASWGASSQLNGTPGAANDAVFETSTVAIYAAGVTGNEIISLEVAGSEVAIFDLSAFGGQPGDFSSRNFVELTWVSTEPVSSTDVRVNFLNDFFDAETGVDSNVAIDRIEIDGAIFQTEDPSVFSTGTYDSVANAVVPRFAESEILHSNGYFQYASGEFVDTTPPSSTITGPAATVPGLVTITGTASDTDSDIRRVRLRVKRLADSTYWNGEAWVTSPGPGTYVTATGTEAWSYSLNLEDGNYRVNAFAIDTAGNVQTVRDARPQLRISVETPDTTAPSSTITGPATAEEGTVTITGTASDTDSDIRRVRLRVKRLADSTYWNGEAWVTSPGPGTYVTATGTEAWSYSLNLEDGNYRVNAFAIDTAGNVQTVRDARPQLRISVETPDTTAPSSTITGPATAEEGTVTITGTAADTESNVRRVRVRIQRSSDDLFWNGSTWVASPNTWNNAIGRTNWTYSLPLTPDNYVIRAFAIDSSGNVQGWSDVRPSQNLEVTEPVNILTAGNIIQLENVFYNNALLAGAGNDAVTSTNNNSSTYWELIDAGGNNRFRLRNIANGRYLDGDSFGIDTNANVNAFGTRWQFQETSPNTYLLFSVDYNRYLDANGSNAPVNYDPPALETDDLWVVSLAPGE